jgi:glutathione S-transferase
VGSALNLADVAVLCAALPLFSSVLSAEARQPYPALAAWLASTSQNPHFNRVLGEQQQMQQGQRCTAQGIVQALDTAVEAGRCAQVRSIV